MGRWVDGDGWKWWVVGGDGMVRERGEERMM